MRTLELASMTSTPYFIEFVYDNNGPYYQLVRTRDLAILASYIELAYVFSYCFTCNILRSDVTLW